MLGEVTTKAVEKLNDKDTFEYFVQAIRRCSPKSYAGAFGELKVTHDFLKNFCGDNVRFLAESDKFPGDHKGQFSVSYRWPYGGVGLVTPFNFPIEIPVLQLHGALYMGNAPVIKPCARVGFPMEQWIRMLIDCGLPKEDVAFFYANDGSVMEKILKQGDARTTVFTGSSAVAEKLVKSLKGKVRIEDAGFDWKILGPDVPKHEIDQKAIAWQCDHDAYGLSG